MMDPKNFENLENTFDLPESPKEIEIIEPGEIVVAEKPNPQDHLEKDYKLIRENLKDIIQRGSEAIDGILLVASETQQPRAYEVVASLIKSVADVNKDLLMMHKQIQDIRTNSPLSNQSAGQITNNSIFVGSTTDLQALLKGKMEQLRRIDE